MGTGQPVSLRCSVCPLPRASAAHGTLPDPTCYQRDIDRIVHQGVPPADALDPGLSPAGGGDHYRTRMTHTLEVARIARTIARGLRLNEDLTEAIALGHDWATPLWPCGGGSSTRSSPAGSATTSSPCGWWTGWKKGGEGLNLCYEVRQGASSATQGTTGRRRWKAKSSAWQTKLPTSTTTLTTPCGAGLSTPWTFPGRLPGTGV